MKNDVKTVDVEEDYSIKKILIIEEELAGDVIIKFTPDFNNETIYELQDFFMESLSNEKVISKNLAFQVFEQFNGKWELRINVSNNSTNIQFWRSTVLRYTEGEFEEYTKRTQNGKIIVIKFQNDNYKHYMAPLLKIYGHQMSLNYDG